MQKGLLTTDEIGEIAMAMYSMLHTHPLPVKVPGIYWDTARMAAAMTGRFIAKRLMQEGELP